MTPGFHRPTEPHPDTQEPPSASSTWLALALIVGILVLVIVILSVTTAFNVEPPLSSVPEAPAAQ